MFPAKSWVEISRTAYASNVRTIESRLGEGVALCAVVKANAYGHDTISTVTLAQEAGVNHFGVDSIDEAIEVRKRAPESTIFVLGYTVPQRFRDVIVHNLVQTLYTSESIAALAQEARRQQGRALVNIKLETGTNRQGVLPSNLKSILADIERNADAIDLTSISSHFSSSEDLSKQPITHEQNQRFVQLTNVVERFGFTPRYKHISCSASALLYPETHHTMVRAGLTQFGLWPSEAVRKSLLGQMELAPVLTWKARIAQIKDVPTGEPVGYGQSFIGDRPLRIAIIPIGYYDGYTRLFKDKAHMLIKGQKCRVIGNICMNMCMIDISAVPNVHQGDPVTLIGRDGHNQISVEDLAQWMGTVNYEIPTMIKAHIPRVIV